jgi:hypothetical protein
MGLWEFLRQWPRGRLVAGVAASILVHVLIFGAVVWGLRGGLAPLPTAKKGDTLIVDLAKSEEPASPGTPVPPTPPARPPAAPAARPAPPREAPAPPREERRVASAPRTVAPPPAAPRAAEPEPAAAEPGPRPTESPAPAPRAAEPVPSAPVPATGERREGGERQVAAVPPSGRSGPPSVSEVRSALRSGAGGRGQGRGGIVGEPIPLDTTDPRFHDYFDQIRRQIQAKLTYPCIKNRDTFDCEHKTTRVVVHFGILKSGQLQFVEPWVSSEWAVYDETSMNAIRLAQPFPPVPAALMASLQPGSTGVPIAGMFNFTVYTSLDSILR